MKNSMTLEIGTPYPLGATITATGVNFAASMKEKENCGVILYQKTTGEKLKLPFQEKYRRGNICCMEVRGLDTKQYSYQFYCDNQVFLDPYSKSIIGHEKWGCTLQKEIPETYQSRIALDKFDWENDRNPMIPYENSVMYCLHVRGFTKHPTSGVKGKGTFLGIQEKIPYMKRLGITTIEVMPCYEFDEMELQDNKNNLAYVKEHYKEQTPQEEKAQYKMNYWGYKKGYYFAPKASYAHQVKKPDQELKELIRELHKNEMEFVMQFYFPKDVSEGFLLDVLRYWVLEYHIDGIHLLGENIPLTLIAKDPLFSNTKLMYYDFPCDEIYAVGEIPKYRNLASYQDTFMNDMRRYLKSDEDMLHRFLEHTRRKPQKEAIIHYMTNYYGFTLLDLVSYDRKHNEQNGEENKDGNSYNFSWNCGVEGQTRRKPIVKLRMQQIKNALVFIILSQGTPLIMSGDEFLNTQNGNNNPYCQDNAISWLNWDLLDKNREIFEFTKAVLELKKEHQVFCKSSEPKLMDTLSCGYPDVSYHSEEVWRPVIDNYNRHIGIMYCGLYKNQESQNEDDFFYIAYNMHWENHVFALPNLPKGKKWVKYLETSSDNMDENQETEESMEKNCENRILVPARSITIMIGE